MDELDHWTTLSFSEWGWMRHCARVKITKHNPHMKNRPPPNEREVPFFKVPCDKAAEWLRLIGLFKAINVGVSALCRRTVQVIEC